MISSQESAFDESKSYPPSPFARQYGLVMAIRKNMNMSRDIEANLTPIVVQELITRTWLRGNWLFTLDVSSVQPFLHKERLH